MEQTEIINDILQWTSVSEDGENSMDVAEGSQPEKTSASAFELCRPINEKLATLY